MLEPSDASPPRPSIATPLAARLALGPASDGRDAAGRSRERRQKRFRKRLSRRESLGGKFDSNVLVG
jgi:hypothetical protein